MCLLIVVIGRWCYIGNWNSIYWGEKIWIRYYNILGKCFFVDVYLWYIGIIIELE